MEKWNKEIFENIKINNEIIDVALNVSQRKNKVDLLSSRIFTNSPQLINDIFSFLETQYSSKIENINATLRNTIYPFLGNRDISKLIAPLVQAHQSKNFTLSLENINILANELIDPKLNPKNRYNQNFGIWDNNKNLIYQPPLNKDVVEYELNKCFKNIDKDNNIIDFIISHIKFEKIHPYVDGNGRIGRFIFQKQMSNKLNYISRLPFSWGFYKYRDEYYDALEIAQYDISKSILILLKIIKKTLKTVVNFLDELLIYKSSNMDFVQSISNKISKTLAKDILTSIIIERKTISNKYNINYLTIDKIFNKLNTKLAFNTEIIKGKVTYWNIELEELIDKHFSIK